MIKDVLEHAANSFWPQISLVIFVLCFLGVAVWTYSGRKDRFNHVSQLPLENESPRGNESEESHAR